MAGIVWVRTSKDGLDSASDPLGVSCGPEGPRIGSIPLLRKTALGFVPRPTEELDFIFASIGYPIRFARKQSSLQAIATALNEGDDAHAWFTLTYMRLPVLQDETVRRRLLDAEALLKAGPDDPKHPGWPAGTPSGIGGQFRPKTGQAPTSASRLPETVERATRKAARRTIRARLIAHLKQTNEIKDEAEDKIDALERNSLLLDDIGQMVVQAQDLKLETEAALEFAQLGPRTLQELQVTEIGESFSSYDAFLKYEPEELLEKRFGRAGDGQQYHHIVEEAINDGAIPASQLQSTDNIIRIPTLLHEEISAIYSRSAPTAPNMTLRQWLKGQSYQAQYDYGLSVMRNLGILR
jgi:hypothetical protein